MDYKTKSLSGSIAQLLLQISFFPRHWLPKLCSSHIFPSTPSFKPPILLISYAVLYDHPSSCPCCV
ncbi:hypothetical protein BGY98DRAFT_954358 [Russula aff. rugulosa BPL654]|nr:hypothetical protein BGY98DRAFT_954358 [Russula aff. rugulosa BPL654]